MFTEKKTVNGSETRQPDRLVALGYELYSMSSIKVTKKFLASIEL